MKITSYYDPAQSVTRIDIVIPDRWVIEASRASLFWLKIAQWALERALTPLLSEAAKSGL